MNTWAWIAIGYAAALAALMAIGVIVLRRRYSGGNKYAGLKLRDGWERDHG